MTSESRKRRVVFLLMAISLSAMPVAAQEARDVEFRIAAYRPCAAPRMVPRFEISYFSDGEEGGTRRVVTEPQELESPVPEAYLRDPEAWILPQGASERHHALRDKAGLATVPEGLQVRGFREFRYHGSHWLESYIASRDPSGLWTVEHVKDYLTIASGALPPIHVTNWTLPDDDGARLDELLADSCLDREPLRSDHWTGSAFAGADDRMIFEILGRDLPLRLERVYGGFGRSAEIMHIIYRARPELQAD